MIDTLKKRIQAAKGEIPADLLLKKGRVVNVFTGALEERDVAVYGGFIVGTGSGYHGEEEIDLEGKWVVSGLIDGHIHVESSMLLPSRLAAALLPHGTTAIVSDPHEIANVMGIDGVKLLLRESRTIPFDIFFMAPSCVPATHLETSGARLKASDLAELKDEPRVLGLAEMMNFPGVLNRDPEVLEKLVLFEDRVIDGHCPSLTGQGLHAYLAAGIRSDHETFDIREGMEKVKNGMMLMIREGTSAKNMETLLPLVTDMNSRRFCFVSDDLHPQDILRRGHLNFMIKKAIAFGLSPVTAVQMATLNPAEFFGLRGRGAVAPGFRADLVVLDDLKSFSVESVYKDGALLVSKGVLTGFPAEGEHVSASPSLNIRPIKPEDFRIRHQVKKARVMEIIPGQILTGTGCEDVISEDGWVLPDIERDILKLAIIERHRATGNIGLGLVRGFGLKEGALASSVAHDSHNVIAVGTNDGDMFIAVKTVKEMGGGMAATKNGEVTAQVALEIAGLITDKPLTQLVAQLDEINLAAVSMGCRIPDPFMCLSFLALPVIPELKLTDLGLVDVNRFGIVPLFIE